MKKLRLASLLAVIAALFAPAVSAQMPQMPQLPTDPEVRIGHLPNGLTYYIRHNEKPKGQADFYIAQKVGSVQEQPNQLGLAHFLEHMCFNDTKHYPDSNLIAYLANVGVKFGENLNAYTSVDQTVYNISAVPTARTTVQDSVLLIIRDWAGDLLLTTKEINRQRDVIHEEWRMRGDATFRMTEKALPLIYGADSRYATVMPIGTMDVIDYFPEQALRDYYKTWYRPDLQAVIVVGDIDPDYIEGRIKDLFSDLTVPKGAPAREYPPVPDFEGTRYALMSDKEQSYNLVMMSFLSDRLPDELANTQAYYMAKYIEAMIQTMLNERFQEICSKPDSPFASLACYFGGFFYSTRVKDAFTVQMLPKEDTPYPAFEAMYREILRARNGGFTQSEYDRARAEYISTLERHYNNRAAIENSTYVNEYVDNFLEGAPIPGIEIDWQIAQALSQQIPVEMINAMMPELITDDNRVIISYMKESPEVTLPTPEGLKGITDKVGAETIEAFVDQMRDDPLIPCEPAPGWVVSETRDDVWDATVWTLNNGARVVVRPTKFKEDEILFKAFAQGGTQWLPAEYDNELNFSEAFGLLSLGSYNNTDLQKYLKGKQVQLSPDFTETTREFEGATTPKDLPTMLELLHVYFTLPRMDLDEFSAQTQAYASYLKTQQSDPMNAFATLFKKALFKSPRRAQTTPEIVLAARGDVYPELAAKMTANAADYTFIFTGNVDPATLKPLVELYIGSLDGDPATAVTAPEPVNPDLFTAPGPLTVTDTFPMETPQTWALITETANLPYDAVNPVAVNAAAQILSQRLVQRIRQEMGAVYSIGAQSMMTRTQTPQNVVIQMGFPMKPEMKDAVVAEIRKIMTDMESDVTADELASVAEFLLKEYNEGLEQNGPWLQAYIGNLINGVDTYHVRPDVIKGLTPQTIMDTMAKINAQDGFKVIILDPAQ